MRIHFFPYQGFSSYPIQVGETQKQKLVRRKNLEREKKNENLRRAYLKSQNFFVSFSHFFFPRIPLQGTYFVCTRVYTCGMWTLLSSVFVSCPAPLGHYQGTDRLKESWVWYQLPRPAEGVAIDFGHESFDALERVGTNGREGMYGWGIGEGYAPSASRKLPAAHSALDFNLWLKWVLCACVRLCMCAHALWPFLRIFFSSDLGPRQSEKCGFFFLILRSHDDRQSFLSGSKKRRRLQPCAQSEMRDVKTSF